MISICGVACELSKFFCIVCIHTHWKPMDMKLKSIRHLKQIDNTFKVRRQSKHSGRLQCIYLLFDISFSILKIYVICDQLPYTLLHQLPSLYYQKLHHLRLALLWHRSHLYCLLDVGYLNTCCFCVANPMSSYSQVVSSFTRCFQDPHHNHHVLCLCCQALSCIVILLKV